MSDPAKIVISRSVSKHEHVKLLDILNSVLEPETDVYYFIDLGEVISYDLKIYSFTKELIEWDCKVLGVGPRAATFMEGRYPHFIFDHNYLLYRNNIGPVKRYVATTSDYIMNVVDEQPEVFVSTFELAVDYFTKIANIQGIIDIYEEDDREEGEGTY